VEGNLEKEEEIIIKKYNKTLRKRKQKISQVIPEKY